MSPLDRPVPPAGEEIHIPGGSLQPLGLTVGITIALLGITIHWILVAFGGILTVAVLYKWIKEAREEYVHLPLDHHAPLAETTHSGEQASSAPH